LRQDLVASVVVFLVALPLCMGIAVASGVPPALGIVTGVIGGLVVGVFAGSPLQVSGPAAGLTVLVYELVQTHGLAVLGTVVLGAGVLQVVSGLLGFGRWFRAISPSVIQGMLSGIGVLIFASQFHVMVDDDPPGGGLENLLTIPQAVWSRVVPPAGDSHQLAAGIGVVTIAALLLWERFRPRPLRWLPGSLVAVVVAAGAAASFALPIVYVAVPDRLADSFTFPTLGSLAQLGEAPILAEVVAFALIASAETLLCATAVDRMHDGPRTHYDRELLAQGVGNCLCGVLGALPMTGVIVRSSANIEAGAKTRVSAVLHGAWLLALVVALPGVLALIPRAGLAAILVYIGLKLVNIPALERLYRVSRTELGIAVATIVIIVVTDLLTGVLAGIVLSALKLLYTFSHLEVTTTRSGQEGEPGRRVDVYLDGAATFVRLPTLADTLENVPERADVHLHLGRLAYVDHASLELIGTWQDQFEKNGGRVSIEWDELRARFGWRLALSRVRGADPGALPPQAREEPGRGVESRP
jgi:MFS superfamily sulfate permease-like transporter